jgi:hypothetical protein
MATPTFILPSAPTYTEGFVNGLNVYPDPTNFVANQVPFTRATTATRTNAAGLIELVPYNLVQYSEQFNQVVWAKSNVNISANVETAPNGTLTADKIIATSAGSNPFMLQDGISVSGAATLSVYAKKGELNWLRLTNLAFSYASAWFDLNNGTIGTVSGGAAPTATITNAGNGWYRCTITLSSFNSVSTADFVIACTNANNTTTGYTGNNVDGIFIWGAQVVEGTSALPYLETITRLNRPRVDFSLGGCPNLLLEPQRTNLALFSEQFDNVYYAKTNATVTANSTTSPSGIVNADTLVENTATGFHLISRGTFALGTNTLSVYAKASTRNFIYVALYNGATDFGAYFNLSNGTIGTIDAGVTATIQDAGSGWYRCAVTYTSAAAVTLSLGIAQSNGVRNYTGNGTGSIFLWGAQVEVGAYPTSYIPTQAASVTRNQDSFQLSNVFTNNLISSAGGTWFVDLRNNRVLTRDAFSNGIQLSGSTDLFQIRNTSGAIGGRLTVLKVIGGTGITLYATTTDTAKIAIKWNGATADIFVNGVKVVAATAFTETALQTLDCSAQDVPKYINSMALWNTPLTDDELEVITGEGFDTYALMASNYNYILQ